MKRTTTYKLTGFLLLIVVTFASPAILNAQTPASHAKPAVAHTDTAPKTAVELADEAEQADIAQEHGEHAEEGHEAPELPTIVHVLKSIKIGGHTLAGTGFGNFITTFEKQFYLIFWIGLLTFGFFGALRLTAHRPGKLQTALEMLVEGLTNFFTGVIGHEHRKHVPLLCSLFLFIWVNNLSALVPGFVPATGMYPTTVTLALFVFFYFIFYGIKDGGFGHFLWHLAGSPRDAVGWAISPLLFILEIIGTLAKPLSLSLRLFGNIMGEDVLLGVLLILGIMMAGAITPDPIIGVPLHVPFMFLVLLGSTIQAMVFALLAAIYLAMVLPHHEHHEEGEEEEKDSHPPFPAAQEDNEESGHVDAGVAPFV